MGFKYIIIVYFFRKKPRSNCCMRYSFVWTRTLNWLIVTVKGNPRRPAQSMNLSSTLPSTRINPWLTSQSSEQTAIFVFNDSNSNLTIQAASECLKFQLLNFFGFFKYFKININNLRICTKCIYVSIQAIFLTDIWKKSLVNYMWYFYLTSLRKTMHGTLLLLILCPNFYVLITKTPKSVKYRILSSAQWTIWQYQLVRSCSVIAFG